MAGQLTRQYKEACFKCGKLCSDQLLCSFSLNANGVAPKHLLPEPYTTCIDLNTFMNI